MPTQERANLLSAWRTGDNQETRCPRVCLVRAPRGFLVLDSPRYPPLIPIEHLPVIGLSRQARSPRASPNKSTNYVTSTLCSQAWCLDGWSCERVGTWAPGQCEAWSDEPYLLEQAETSVRPNIATGRPLPCFPSRCNACPHSWTTLWT